jgi:hypothetical protein
MIPDPFLFQAAKKGFGHCIVITIAASSWLPLRADELRIDTNVFTQNA